VQVAVRADQVWTVVLDEAQQVGNVVELIATHHPNIGFVQHAQELHDLLAGASGRVVFLVGHY
jgi:hypothetical protein